MDLAFHLPLILPLALPIPIRLVLLKPFLGISIQSHFLSVQNVTLKLSQLRNYLTNSGLNLKNDDFSLRE